MIGTSGLHLEEGIGGPGDSIRYYKGVELPVISHEIMTGYLNSGRVNPITAITLGMLEDLGYSVRWEKYTRYTQHSYEQQQQVNSVTTIITTTTSPHVVDS